MIQSFLQYLQYEKRYSTHTCTAYETDLIQFRDYLLHTYQTDNLNEATFSFIRSWIVSMMDEKTAASSINRKLASLRTFYKFLHKRGDIQVNPTLKIKSLKAPKILPHFAEEKVLNNFLDSFDFEGFEGLRDKTVLELLYGTGMRLSELINLKENDINYYDKTMKVLGKRNKERIIPLHSKLPSVIEKYLSLKKANFQASSEYLIVTDAGEKAYPVFIYRLVRRYMEMAGIAGKKSPHILRHTTATHLLDKGADLNAIKDLLGHANLAATQIYTHNTLDKLKQVFEQAHPKA
jgi:integrase/recombinase XerC